MDGLIKGLIDVALGHGHDREEESGPQSREERSRSTWSEVSVSHCFSNSDSAVQFKYFSF